MPGELTGIFKVCAEERNGKQESENLKDKKGEN